ncbi:WD40-repeat-containing domain protein [Baffinella frigidus]|nr:WD40-repeat-containing domain protein [Cryptophyta sp. CCMP2293]
MRSSGVIHDGEGACLCPSTRTSRRAISDECPVIAHTEQTTAITFSKCGQLIASGDAGGAVIVWHTETGDVCSTLQHAQGNDNAVSSISFTCDGSQLVTACYDMSFCLWETVTGARLWHLPFAHSSSLVCIDCSPTDASSFITVGSGFTGVADLKVWDIQAQQIANSFTGAVFCKFSPDGLRIATVGGFTLAHVFLLDSINGLHTMMLEGSITRTVTCGAFSPNGEHFAVGTSFGDVHLWGVGQLAPIHLSVIPLGVGFFFSKNLSMAWERNWQRDTRMATAFAMGYHPRLGAGSMVQGLDAGVHSHPYT